MVPSNIRILRIIRDEGPLSRNEIQQKVGLSLSAISLVVSDLLERNLVQKVGVTGEGVGRKIELIDFNSGSGHILGIDLGARKMKAAVANLSGEVIRKEECPTLAYEGGPKVAERLLNLCRNTIDAAEIRKSKVLAIGVAAPGITEKATDKNLLVPYIPRWSEVPFVSMLETEFDIPVIVENDVNMAIIGEKRWGAGKGSSNLVFLNVGAGIAAGVLVDGNLLRGKYDAAGEVGYMIVDRSMTRDRFLEEGVLERQISGPGIARRWRITSANGNEGHVLGNTDNDPWREIDAETILALAVNGDSVAKSIVDETITCLSIAITNIVTVTNPERVILGGEVGLAFYSFREHLSSFLKHHVPFPPEIVHAQLGSDASVMGAIALAAAKAIEVLEEDMLADNS